MKLRWMRLQVALLSVLQARNVSVHVARGDEPKRDCSVHAVVLLAPAAARSQGFGGDTEAMTVLWYERLLI